MAAARFTVTELLPTPPLPEAMANTRVVLDTAVSVALSLAFQRALAMVAERSSEFISPHSIFTANTPGCVAMRVSMSFLIWARNGHPPMVSFTSISTRPSSVISRHRAMPNSTTSLPNSGSITPRRRFVTSSVVGGANRRAMRSWYRR